MLKACEVIVAPAVFRYSRFQLMDFLHPWVTEPVKLLIPMPIFVANLDALLDPFTFPVSFFLNYNYSVIRRCVNIHESLD